LGGINEKLVHLTSKLDSCTIRSSMTIATRESIPYQR
jgi:hypothetical protein